MKRKKILHKSAIWSGIIGFGIAFIASGMDESVPLSKIVIMGAVAIILLLYAFITLCYVEKEV